MRRTGTLGLAPLILAFAALLPDAAGPTPARGADDRVSPPLPARLEVAAAPYYVGQAIEARVLVAAEGVAPEIDPPASADLEIVPGERGFRPISVTGIGDRVTESNLFFRDYLLVPRRGGKVTIPPFRVRIGPRAGATAPRPIEARQPPAAGRPPGFLGGVGPLEVSSRLVPDAVRLGEPARLEIRLRGPGAFRSTARPALAGLGKVPMGLEVTPAGGDWSPQAAERTWFYTVRASKPGTGKLPPAVVSTFQPSRRGYSTYTSPSPSLRVAAPTTFRPGPSSNRRAWFPRPAAASGDGSSSGPWPPG